MSKIFRKALIASPAALGALLAVSSDAVANPISTDSADRSTSDILQQIEDYSAEGSGNSMDQFNGATQFSDVSPGDWAFQALDDLVRRYDCLKGYPDGTYRGNRALSRYEFAAGLNACLQQIERLIAETTAEFATREDLEILRRLMEEFEAELATLGTRVDNLEARVAFLEDNQFSTTTKLNGEVVTDLSAAFADQKATAFGLNNLDRTDLIGTNGGTVINDGLANLLDVNNLLGLFKGVGVVDSVTMGQLVTNLGAGDETENLVGDLLTLAGGTDNDADDNATFGYRARLNFDTSFFGTDRLRTRLQARNFDSLVFEHLGTTQLDRNKGGDSNDNVEIHDLAYRFQLSDNIRAHIIATGADVDDILDSSSTAPYSEDILPLANSYNTLFYEAGSSDQGIGFNLAFSDSFALDIGYLPDDGEDASQGVFGGEYILPVQLNFYGDKFNLALSYAHMYEKGGDFVDGTDVNLQKFPGADTASILGQNPFVYASGTTGELQASAGVANVFGLQASFDLSDSFNISGYVGYGNAIAVSGPRTGDDADYWGWGINLALPDLGKEGAVLVGGFGQLPRVSVDNGPSDANTSYIANLEYRFPITDNIQLAPGAYAVFNPNGNAANDTIWVGMLRSILKF